MVKLKIQVKIVLEWLWPRSQIVVHRLLLPCLLPWRKHQQQQLRIRFGHWDFTTTSLVPRRLGYYYHHAFSPFKLQTNLYGTEQTSLISYIITYETCCVGQKCLTEYSKSGVYSCFTTYAIRHVFICFSPMVKCTTRFKDFGKEQQKFVFK